MHAYKCMSIPGCVHQVVLFYSSPAIYTRLRESWKAYCDCIYLFITTLKEFIGWREQSLTHLLFLASTKAFNLACFMFLGHCVQFGSKTRSSKHGLLSVHIVYDGLYVNKTAFVNTLR